MLFDFLFIEKCILPYLTESKDLYKFSMVNQYFYAASRPILIQNKLIETHKFHIKLFQKYAPNRIRRLQYHGSV